MLMTDDCSNVSSRANSECEYQYETEHNERQRCLALKDPVHCIPFHKFLQSQVSKVFLTNCIHETTFLLQSIAVCNFVSKMVKRMKISQRNVFPSFKKLKTFYIYIMYT